MRIRVNDIEYDCLDYYGASVDWWDNRQAMFLTLPNLTVEEAVQIFYDSVPWGIYVVEDPDFFPDRETFISFEEYCKAGPITDLRNDSIMVIMGQLTEIEKLKSEAARMGNSFISENEAFLAYQEGVNSL